MPKDSILAQIWLAQLKVWNKVGTNCRNIAVCDAHFEEQHFISQFRPTRLAPNAVPTLLHSNEEMYATEFWLRNYNFILKLFNSTKKEEKDAGDFQYEDIELNMSQ